MATILSGLVFARIELGILAGCNGCLAPGAEVSLGALKTERRKAKLLPTAFSIHSSGSEIRRH
jgi:hypothetical protein